MTPGRRKSTHVIIFVDKHIIVAAKAPGIPCVPERPEIPAKAARPAKNAKSGRAAKPASAGLGRPRGPYVPGAYEGPALNKILEKEYGELFTVLKIDKDTSGLVLFARTKEARSKLNGQFREKKVVKAYEALVTGKPGENRFTVNYPLTANGDSLLRTIVDNRKGRRSVTAVTLLRQLGPYALIKAEPATGRIHQIRVHLKTAGYPVLCDPLYGNGEALKLSDLKKNYRGDLLTEKPLIARTALHAKNLRFFHPATGESMDFSSEYPRDFAAAIYQLRKLYSV